VAAAWAALVVAASAGCGSSSTPPLVDSHPRDESQARDAIRHELAGVADELPKPAHLTRIDPAGYRAIASTVACPGGEQGGLVMVVYWVTGLASGDESKYRDVIQGAWQRRQWRISQQQDGPTFTTSGGYEFFVTITTDGMTVGSRSPCIHGDSSRDDVDMPNSIGG
jgi:hypothetical protein